MLIENLERKLATAMAMPKQQSHTVTGVAAECRPAIAIMAMIVGQQATQPACRMPETIQEIINAAAIGIGTPSRNTVYIFLLHYICSFTN